MDTTALAKRARLQRITDRATDLDHLRDMLDGTYQPRNGDYLPSFNPGSAREKAFRRATRTTSTIVPVLASKSLAALDFQNTTWSDANTNATTVDDRLNDVDLPELARALALEYKLTGVAAAIAHTPTHDGRALPPTIDVMHGVNIPYTNYTRPGVVTGWYRTIQFADDHYAGQLRWYVETADFDTNPITWRVWRSLTAPYDLAHTPDHEFTSTAQPRYAIYAIAPDGLPVSPMLANMGRILGLYATELRLATSEELSAYPMLKIKGDAAVEQIGPAEMVGLPKDGDAEWMTPGALEELREQVRLKRDQVREAFSLPAGALGGQTPSGEALEEANRAFLQDARATSSAIGAVLTDVVNDYLVLNNLPPVTVDVPIDRSYVTRSLLDVVEKGVDLGAVPKRVAARLFQQFVGSAYSDDELEAFLADEDARSLARPAGFLAREDDMSDSPDDDDEDDGGEASA